MKPIIISTIIATLLAACNSAPQKVSGGDERITFVGRTDRSVADAPKQWAAGAYFTFAFRGKECIIDFNDENLYGEKYNIIEVVVDEQPSQKFYTHGIRNRLIITAEEIVKEQADSGLNILQYVGLKGNGEHHVTVCRDTETGMGYTQLLSVGAQEVLKWTPATNLKIEFIGNSITCGAEADTTTVPTTNYKWGDWHRAYYGYGPRTARNLNAQWALTSVSGIGLIHSCCDMKVTMPQVYDKYVLCEDKIDYNFTDFRPDVICSCLGQNDGIQDSTTFCSAYVDFIKNVANHNPQAKHIVLLSSPMDNGELSEWLRPVLISVAEQLKADGLTNVSTFFFSQAWNNGGADHPSTEEHAQIADELTQYLKTIL